MNPDLFTYAPQYPDKPGFKEATTSRAAAQSMEPHAARLRRQCLDALKRHGPATADEIASVLDLSVLSVRPRFSELNADHFISDTGTRRPNASGRSAKVWRAS